MKTFYLLTSTWILHFYKRKKYIKKVKSHLIIIKNPNKVEYSTCNTKQYSLDEGNKFRYNRIQSFSLRTRYAATEKRAFDEAWHRLMNTIQHDSVDKPRRENFTLTWQRIYWVEPVAAEASGLGNWEIGKGKRGGWGPEAHPRTLSSNDRSIFITNSRTCQRNNYNSI